MVKGLLVANQQEEDAMDYTDEADVDEGLPKVIFKIRLDNKGLIVKRSLFGNTTTRATCMTMNEYVNLLPHKVQVIMLMPMFIVNSYKKKKIYTGLDEYEEAHEFNLQQVTYWEQYCQYQMELVQDQTSNAQLIEHVDNPY